MKRNLKETFKHDSKNRLLKFRSSWNSTARKHYYVFLNTYGSHLVSSLLLVSSISQIRYLLRATSPIRKEISRLKAAWPWRTNKCVRPWCFSVFWYSWKWKIPSVLNVHEERSGCSRRDPKALHCRSEWSQRNDVCDSIHVDVITMEHSANPVYVGRHNNENFIRAVNLEYY